MTAPVNVPWGADAINRRLVELSRELEQIVDTLKLADLDASQKREAANRAMSRAFVKATGSMELRKHEAVLDGDRCNAEDEALIAEALVRHLIRDMRRVDKRIDTGRSMGTNLRGEHRAAGLIP